MNTVKSKDGTTLAYDVYGKGAPVIFITGAICSRNFFPVKADAKIFAKEFSLYNYDRRGGGDSGDNPPYSIEKEIEDIEALIDAAGGSAYVYGHSSGAVLALEAALRLPNKVRKIILCDASYVFDEAEKKEYAALQDEVSGLLASGKHKEALQRFLLGIGMPKLFAFFLPIMPGWKRMKALAPTLKYDMLLTQDFFPRERAASLNAEVHILCGEKNTEKMKGVANGLAEAIPKSRITILSDQDHMVSAKVIMPFLVEFFR